jgi:hypothetical protein
LFSDGILGEQNIYDRFYSTYNLLYTFTTITIFAICMQLCWKRVAATQFTLYMTVYNIGYALGAWSLGVRIHLKAICNIRHRYCCGSNYFKNILHSKLESVSKIHRK